MKKFFILHLLGLIITVGLTSCLSLEAFLEPADHSVKSILTENQVKTVTEKSEIEHTYLKKFIVKDSLGKIHVGFLYDDSYMKIDDVIYAYKYDRMMYYRLCLNLLGTKSCVEGSEKIIGFTCWASPVSNPDLSVHFIIGRELFAQKHYRSQYEASQIDGVYFAGLKRDGYVNAWGQWKTYTWLDHLEEIFGTEKQDVRQRMYMAMEVEEI